eukprot:scaffold3787_cov258-Pinguiococcus_pyrenoidosus.AAC.7
MKSARGKAYVTGRDTQGSNSFLPLLTTPKLRHPSTLQKVIRSNSPGVLHAHPPSCAPHSAGSFARLCATRQS